MRMKKTFTIPAKRVVLEKELTEATLARTWGPFEIHFVIKKTAPIVIAECNRISTVMFNLDYLDGDVFDEIYTYIVAYDKVNGEVASFYRYIICKNTIDAEKNVHLSTSHYFKFSYEFVEKILPATIELGRSVVNKFAKLHEKALQAVWIGLGILIYEYHQYPKNIQIDYLFGKFSLQWRIYNKTVRNHILWLCNKHFPPMCGDNLNPYIQSHKEFKSLLRFTEPRKLLIADNYKEDRKTLIGFLKKRHLSMPRLVETYCNLGGGLEIFDSVENIHLKSTETAILQKIQQVDSCYIRRFVDGYIPINPALFK